MSNDLNRSRETSHFENTRSLHLADPTRLQKLRQDHTCFTRSAQKSIMTPRMQWKEDQQQRNAGFQAQEECTRDMKMLAERKGVTSGQIVLGMKVPRCYQKALGGTLDEANAYFEQLTKDMDKFTKQDWWEKVYYGFKTKNKAILSAHETYWQIYNKDSTLSRAKSDSDNDAGPSSPYGTELGDNESPHAHHDGEYGSRESSPQRDSGSKDDGARDVHSQRLEPLGKNKYFTQRYAYKSIRQGYYAEGKAYEEGPCVLNATMILLLAQGIKHSEDKIARDLEYSRGATVDDMYKALQRNNSHPYKYQNGKKISLQKLDEAIESFGRPAASQLTYSHRIVVDRIEKDSRGNPKFVCLIDGDTLYKVTIEEWKNAWVCGEDIVPAQKWSSKNKKILGIF